MPGIGIVFDIDALGGGYYGATAWRLFMHHLRPESIAGCSLREGDTDATLNGERREFCIAAFGSLADLQALRRAFENSSEPGLAQRGQRFIDSPAVEAEPLVDAGRIDAMGRLVVDQWSRSVHDRCRDCGWGFAPESAPVDLPAELAAELDALKADKGRTGSSPASPAVVVQQNVSSTELVRVFCPNCSEHADIPRKWLGKRAQCNRCDAVFNTADATDRHIRSTVADQRITDDSESSARLSASAGSKITQFNDIRAFLEEVNSLGRAGGYSHLLSELKFITVKCRSCKRVIPGDTAFVGNAIGCPHCRDVWGEN